VSSDRLLPSEQAPSARLCPLADTTIRPFANNINRREYTVVYRASLSNKTNPLKLRFWNKSNDVGHGRSNLVCRCVQ
jgi:hypothetical protein